MLEAKFGDDLLFLRFTILTICLYVKWFVPFRLFLLDLTLKLQYFQKDFNPFIPDCNKKSYVLKLVTFTMYWAF